MLTSKELNRETMREMKPGPLQSLQLVAQPAEIAQETLKCMLFCENFRKLYCRNISPILS